MFSELEQAPPAVSWREALATWSRVALLSFGGPAGQIAVMHRILVEEKKWLSEERFLHALNYCMLLPGPEAQQLAVYSGWLLNRTLGGIMAGTLFILPGFVSILALSVLYAVYQESTAVQAVFFGLKPAVLAIVVQAVLRIGRRVLHSSALLCLAACSFVAIFFLEVPFPAIIVSAGLIGFLGGRLAPQWFSVSHGSSGTSDLATVETVRLHFVAPSLWRSARVCLVFAGLWLGPMALLFAFFGPQSIFVQEGVFFSKAAVVTFGGAYAVLAYIAQQAVDNYGWLQPGEMLDGLGMAETTPGPLIQVVQFVGFMGAYRDAGSLSPLTAGVLGSLVTTWVTFVPCFLWIFLGAPYVERLRGNRLLGASLAAITAAVVGVILNLAIWFAAHTLFRELQEERVWGLRLLLPEWRSLDLAALAVAALALWLTFQARRGMFTTLCLSAACGAALYWVFR